MTVPWGTPFGNLVQGATLMTDHQVLRVATIFSK